MMRRGMVLKLNDNYAITATDDSDFIKIKIRKGMHVGQKIFFFDEDIITLKEDNKKHSAMPYYCKVVAVLAACVVMAVMMNNLFVRDNKQPLYAMVSLDVNPSVELGIDETFNVVKIDAMNEESKEILDIELTGKPLRIAVCKILSDIEASGYALASDNAMLVSTFNFKNDNNEPLKKIIAEGVCLAMSENLVFKNTKVIFIDADKEDLEAAEKEKLSIGKYKLLEMGEDKIDKKTILEGRISDLIEKEEIKDDFEKNKTIQIIDGEDLQRLKKIEKGIDSLKDVVNQIIDTMDNDEAEKLGDLDLVDDIEKMENKLINEDLEFLEIYQSIEAINKKVELEKEEELNDSNDFNDENEELEDEEPNNSNDEGEDPNNSNNENEGLEDEDPNNSNDENEGLEDEDPNNSNDENKELQDERIAERENLLKDIATLQEKLKNGDISEKEIESIEKDLIALYEELYEMGAFFEDNWNDIYDFEHNGDEELEDEEPN